MFTITSTAQKMEFSIKDFFIKMWPNQQFPADLVTLTGEIFYGKLHFLCTARYQKRSSKGGP